MFNRIMIGMGGRPYQMGNALLCRGGGSLSRTFPANGDRTRWTFSTWVRRAALAGECLLRATGDSGGSAGLFFGQTNADDLTFLAHHNGTAWDGMLSTAARFRDPGAWMHVVAVWDSANAATSDRLRLYINGGRVTAFASAVYPAQGTLSNAINTARQHDLFGPGSGPFSGAVGETVFVDGLALDAAWFGVVDLVTGSWRPRSFGGIAWGGNGCSLGRPWSAAGLGTDYSGQGNHWTPSGFSASDVLTDSPTNVFATLSPIDRNGLTLSAGNLVVTSTANNVASRGTLAMSSGKWAWEIIRNDTDSTSIGWFVGVVRQLQNNSNPFYGTPNSYLYYSNNGYKYVNGTGSSFGASWGTAGDCVRIEFDVDAGVMTFFKNGTSQGAISGIPAGTYVPVVSRTGGTASTACTLNFGQRAFFGTASANFKAICTAELPETSGVTSGSFVGNANANGPCVFTGAVPDTLTINGNAATWGTHADKLSTGFKLRTASTSYNSTGTNTWTATYDRRPTVGVNHCPANAQGNP